MGTLGAGPGRRDRGARHRWARTDPGQQVPGQCPSRCWREHGGEDSADRGRGRGHFYSGVLGGKIARGRRRACLSPSARDRKPDGAWGTMPEACGCAHRRWVTACRGRGPRRRTGLRALPKSRPLCVPPPPCSPGPNPVGPVGGPDPTGRLGRWLAPARSAPTSVQRWALRLDRPWIFTFGGARLKTQPPGMLRSP